MIIVNKNNEKCGILGFLSERRKESTMSAFNTDHLEQCIKTLELSFEKLQGSVSNTPDYEVFRNATVKGFELTLETAGKLLRKALKNYITTPRFVDGLTFKELLRHATKHGLLETKTVERWMAYRDNRNDTAHDYGVEFTKTTLKLLPSFIHDAKDLLKTLKNK